MQHFVASKAVYKENALSFDIKLAKDIINVFKEQPTFFVVDIYTFSTGNLVSIN